MKKILYMICAVAALFVALSCGPQNKPGEDKTPDPVFPAAISREINPGESVQISFTADRDWELSIPTDKLAWFYIDDKGMKEYKVKGSKGSVTVSIHAENVSSNYEIRTCTATLKMGDKSAVVATITLLPEVRTVGVFEAKTDGDGRFVVVGGGDYEYMEDKASTLGLRWPKGLSSFILPVKIVSNFEWSVKDDHPKWLELSKTSSEGEATTLVLRGVPTEYPLDNDGGKITFLDTKTKEAVYEISVTIPGCKDIVYTDLENKAIELNILGEFDQNGTMMSSYSFHVTSTLDTEVFVAEKQDGKFVRPQAPWASIKLSYPGGEPSANVIQDRIVTVTAGQNKGAAREAYILAVPGYVLAKSDLSSVAKDYIVAQINQAGLDPAAGWGNIAPVNSAFKMSVKGAGIHRTEASEPYYQALSSKFGTNEIYTLEYNNWYSYEGAELSSSQSVAEVAYFTPDGSSTDYEGNLEVMFPDSDKHDVFNVMISYFDEGYEEAVALYDDAGKVIAVILCRLTETYWPDVKFEDIRFVAYDLVGEDGDPDDTMLPQDVVLEKLTSGEIYEQYKSYGIPVWRLVYEAPTSKKNAMIYVPPFPTENSGAIEIHPQPAWINVESAFSDRGLPYIHVSMSNQMPESGNVGYIVLKGGDRPLFVLVCERAFMN